MADPRILAQFKSYISGQKVDLDGLLSDIQDSWSSNWKKEQVYGRLDPIATFIGNERTISFQMTFTRSTGAGAPDYPAGNYSDMSDADKTKFAKANAAENKSGENMKNINKFVQMIYPGYEDFTDTSPDGGVAFNTNVLKSSPVVGIKIANIVASKDGDYLPAYCTSFSKVVENKAAFDTASITAGGTLSVGFFHRIVVNFSFTILHDFDLGHKSDGSTPGLANSWPFKTS